MEFAQSRSMPNADERGRQARQARIEAFLRGDVERASGFVENREARMVEQQPGERKTLLLPALQHVRPIELGVETTELLHQLGQIDFT